MKNLMKFLACVMLLGFTFSCSDDDNSAEPARMSVRLVDMPGDYENVFIDVQDVVVKYEGEDDETVIGPVNTGIYDVLELTGGASVLLVDDELPAGRISQIRLILGENNSVVIDGQSYDLDTPSAQQSGLKLNLNEDLEGGIFYEFVLDFDADKSIVERGNGTYSLQPVIRAELVAETGAIAGSITPITAQTMVTATDGVTDITTFADDAGNYVLSGVPDGTYTVTITPDPASGLQTVTILDVDVVSGQITDLGSSDLN
ncbi:DUF4382 domain-containing protein [Nonlabens xiamenensis]|uniref:DUF4382 domain-containing protein n=1 Tax=Nonlabens xiamenensis TaxID=2341043 RepID=UPI001F0BB2FF|nr:DUF4382 domain-containing protein [Nonlabens xiamenensis]